MGRPPKITPEQAAAALAEHGTEHAAASALGVHLETLRRALARAYLEAGPAPVPDPDDDPPADLPRPRVAMSRTRDLDALSSLLAAARGAVVRGDLGGAGVALDRAASVTGRLVLSARSDDW